MLDEVVQSFGIGVNLIFVGFNLNHFCFYFKLD